MRNEKTNATALLVIVFVSALLTFAQPIRRRSESAPSATVVMSEQADALRLEGEKRFKANCGRCHMAPHKFPPCVMASVVRHMRVRATITDEDMRVILNFLSQ
jgi:cytochrome c5